MFMLVAIKSKYKEDRKGFWSNGVSLKAIKDINSALVWSPIQVLKKQRKQVIHKSTNLTRTPA